MKYLSYLSIVAFFCFGGCDSKVEDVIEDTQERTTISKETLQSRLIQINEELQSIGSVSHLESYIQNIIKNGSTGLGYPGGDMDAGIAAPQDAKDIARYVVTLTGQKSSDDEKADKAVLFYTSNCGGCHGNDGKGIDGNFPNLTKTPYKGVIRLKENLLKEKREIKERLETI